MSYPEEPKGKLILPRRSFFRSAGTFMAGAAMTAAGCSALMTKKQDKDAQAAAATWPLPYKTLDVEDVRGRAHAGYYKGK